MILASIGLAVFFAFVYLILLRCCAGVITWLVILAYCGVLFFMGIIFYSN